MDNQKITQTFLTKYNKIQIVKNNLNLIYWDLETSTPKKQIPTVFKLIESISSQYYDLITEKAFLNLAQTILNTNNEEKITKLAQKVLEENEKLNLYSKQENLDLEQLANESNQKWKDAREKNDFNIFLPYLQKGIEVKKDYIKRLKKQIKLTQNYDYLLRDFDKDLTTNMCDDFFKLIRERIVPLYLKKQKNTKNVELNVNITQQQQEKLALLSAKLLNFDFDAGLIAKSAHPFSSQINANADVRMTYRLEKNNPLDVMFTIFHETGHSLQSQLAPDNLVKYGLHSHPSYVIAEAISRTYENYFGRNKNFVAYLTPILNQELNLNFSVEQYYNHFNQIAQESKIRVESDELSYPIHILIRYEIEKEIFNNNLNTDTLEQLWNEKYKKYLNVEILNVNEGILQDVHWASWSFGYFPTYALGSALGINFYNVLKNNIDIEKCLSNANFTTINKFYQDTIFKHGALKSTNELILNVCSKEFSPLEYIEYLEAKFDN